MPISIEVCNSLISGYYCGGMFCRSHYNRGGAAIFIKEGVSCNPIDISDLIIEKVFEAVALLFETFTVVCIYRPPSANVSLFFQQLELCFQRIDKKRKHIFICGDFNIDILSEDRHKRCYKNQLKSFLSERGMYSLTHEATRAVSKTAIDHIITNAPSSLLTSNCSVEVGLSDHSMQCVTICSSETNQSKSKPKPYIYKRLYPAHKVQLFVEALTEEKWTCMYEEGSVNKKFKCFHDKFMELYDKHFPVKKLKQRDTIKKDWVTKGLKITAQNYRSLSEEVKGDKNNIELKKYFLRYRKIYRKVVRNAKRLSVKEEIENSKNITKSVWKLINKNMGRGKKQCDTNIEIKVGTENNLCNDASKVANEFNEYYATVASKLVDNKDSQGTLFKNHCSFSMFMTPLTENDIIIAISKLKNKKCSGFDNVTDEMIKICHKPLIKPLLYLIQLSFNEGVFPDQLKISKIMPLYKKGDNTDVGNYRPVANISVFAKIYEFVMDDKLRSYLYKYKLLSDSQFGFIKNKSTSDAILNFIHLVYNAFEKKEFVAGMLFDMSKAFDLVDHQILLKKLESHGIRGPILKWFSSYLCNRMQLVEITKFDGKEQKVHRSNFHAIQCGVPQGSILGPLLFIIYINDLCEYLTTGHFVNFADDANLLLRALSVDELESLLEKAFEEMKEWCSKNKLILNDSKTNIVQFRSNEKVQQNLNSKFSDLHVNYAKFLGINVDQFLRWNKHIESLKPKLSNVIFGIKKIRELSDEKTALLAYYGMFHSIISYGTILWGNATMCHDIFILQKKAVRAVFKLRKRTSCKEYFKEKKIMTVPSIYIYQILKNVKQNESKFLINKDIYGYNTRQKLNIHVKSGLLKVTKDDIFYKGAKMYNYLPIEVRKLPYKIFKKVVKVKLTQFALYSIEDYFKCGFMDAVGGNHPDV